ncbi:twin-arginine translocation pathway signal [Bosea sp. 2RAB26]|uniref:twin-arginine translocation pathway signal n=1 Tax=Bosea sp. 2RAB26 TaxID=3237476 RepID=UPI003F92C5D8
MTRKIIVRDRRAVLAGAAAVGAAALLPRSFTSAIAQSSASSAFSPTETMPGGSNNYVANAPVVQNLGTGFVASGVVRRAGDGAPLSNLRIQIWAATERGGERVPSNRGSVMTGPDGAYRLEISPIVPQFGQPHIHIAYDDPGFTTLFLRPVLNSRHDTSITADFVLAPAASNEPRRS